MRPRHPGGVGTPLVGWSMVAGLAATETLQGTGPMNAAPVDANQKRVMPKRAAKNSGFLIGEPTLEERWTMRDKHGYAMKRRSGWKP